MSQGWNILCVALLAALLCCSQGCGTINAQLLLLQGNQLYDSGQYPEALAKYEQGLEQAQGSSLKVKKIIGDLLSNTAMVLNWKLQQHKRSLEYYQQALAIKRETGDRKGEGNVLGNMSEAYLNFGQYDRALEYAQQALAIHREVGDRRGEGNDLSTIGLIYIGLNQYERSLEYAQQALAISREVGDPGNEAGELNRLGLVYGYLGQDKQYREYLEQSLAIQKKIKNRGGGKQRS